ncbi:MAG: YcbK family protein [Deltaproteobacteria bacterium]|nr:YcbK family protein [Deltaproteobacteria bacterium]
MSRVLTGLAVILVLLGARSAPAHPPQGRRGAASIGRGTHTPRNRGRHARGRSGRSAAQKAVYAAAVARWQRVPAGVRTTWRDGLRDITFYAVNTGDQAVVRLFEPDGTLRPEAAREVRRLAGDRRSGEDHELDPRILALLYRLVSQLDAPQISIISGFRAPRGRGHSLHSEGRAVDIVVPGIDLERVAQVARGFGHVGVGTYPSSGFVHLDVRDRSYFWVDRSGPGQRGRVRQVRLDESRAADLAFDPAAERIQPRMDDRSLAPEPTSTMADSEPVTRTPPRSRRPRRPGNERRR